MKVRHNKFTAIALVILILLLIPPVLAQDGTGSNQRDPKEEQEIYDRLSQISPEAVEVFEEATLALDADDWMSAKVGFEQVLALAPDFPDALRRLSYVERMLGDVEAAVQYAEKACETDPSPYNQAALASALLQRDTPVDRAYALQYAQAAAEAQPDDISILFTLTLAAMANEDQDTFSQASAALVELEPENPAGRFFAGIAAATDGKWELAEQELLLAEDLGMDPELVQEALDQGIRTQARLRRALKGGLYSLVGWLVGLGLLTVVGGLLSRLMLGVVRRTQTSGEFETGRGERFLRNVYRVVIAITSLYYYISIPFLILIIVAIVLGLGYLFLVIGSIPLRLALFVLLAALYTLFSIVRSLVVRRGEIKSGRPLARKDAPALWSLAKEVAATVGTRPIEEIYVSPGTEIGVMEQGSIWQKLRGAGRRVLILGLGALPGMTQSQFQAILAHEYGHFSNRDTAGGNLAGLVRASLYQMAFSLAATGQARWYNPAWLFVNGFYRIYLRITLGASRLQEILADRYAAAAYGAGNLIRGLHHMIRQELAFGAGVNSEIKESREQGRELRNLYTLPLSKGGDLPEDMAEAKAEILSRPTSPYDSHPAPKDRFELLERLGAQDQEDEDPAPVWDLLEDPDALQAEMTEVIERLVQSADKQ